MRSLITGIAGFAGRHLAARLVERGDEVHGTLHSEASRSALRGLSARQPGLDDRLYLADVVDAETMARVIAAVQPQLLFHLAGMTFVPEATADPAAAMRVNVIGGVHVFAAVQRHAPNCRVIAISSGDVYGAVEAEELPIRESCPMRPLSAYGASKASLDLVAQQWARGAGLDVVCVRPFNHTGPGQRPEFVCPNFARQLQAVARGQRAPVLSVGDLDAVRDFTDVRDVAAAYLAAAQGGVSGEAYNVCSGVGRSVRSVLEALSAIVGVEVRTQVSDERLRPASVPVIIGCADKLRAATGWQPRIEWQQTLTDVVADA